MMRECSKVDKLQIRVKLIKTNRIKRTGNEVNTQADLGLNSREELENIDSL